LLLMPKQAKKQETQDTQPNIERDSGHPTEYRQTLTLTFQQP
jgi:hypothetical protein